MALEKALERLPPADREMMLLVYQVYQPEDWTADWPPKFEDVGVYIGLKYEDAPLSEAAIRYRRAEILKMYAGTRGQLRRAPRASGGKKPPK